jgi:hypothetical protein
MTHSFLQELSDFALTLGDEGHRVLSAPVHWVMLSNGDADFHDNVIFFGFGHGQSDPGLVLKVPRLPENGGMLRTEYEHLAALWNCLGPRAAEYLPRPYALRTLQGMSVLVLSYIPGESLTRLSPKSFWADSTKVSALAVEAAETLRTLNRSTESPIDRAGSSSLGFAEKADMFKELFTLTSEEQESLSDLTRTLENRALAATQQVILQGDFWHGNMIRDAKQGTLKLIDWQFARWSVDASMDVYFFLLAGALSASQGGSAQERARAACGLLKRWRADVIPAYLSAYGMPEHYLLLPPRAGMLMCCVEKAVRPALAFGYRHPDDELWRELFAALQSWGDGHDA